MKHADTPRDDSRSVQEVSTTEHGTLSHEEREFLRQYRADPEALARALLYRAHYGEVRAHAAEIMRDILSGSIESPEALEDRLHEDADGSRSVFMYAGALRTVYASEEWDAGPEELGFADFASGVESMPELMTRAAYWALRADLRERLGLFVSHPPTPGSDEARELGFDADSLDGLDLSDGDTFPANRTGSGDTTEDEESDDDEPSPEDYVVSSNGFRLSVSIVEGEHVGDFAEHEEAEQAIREHRARTSPEFYPEVWSVSDHGNVSRYSEDGFAWDVQPSEPFAGFDCASVEEACARTAFVLAWADAEERAGRTYPGADLDDVAPAYVPGRFRAWARDVFAGAIGATTRGDGIAPHWANAKPETLGRALALSCGGWTDGLGEADLPHPIGLPSMDADGRLWVEPSEFRTDPPSVEDLRALAKDVREPASIAERIARAMAEDDPEDVLALADELLGGSGVESLDLPAPDEHESAGSVRYVNRGDTYTATLCYVEDVYGSRFVVSAWGSLLEQAEEERTYATGEARCAHCGDWGCEEHERE